MAGVVAIIDDLFFVAKVQETAKQTGAPLRVLRAAEAASATLREARPAMILLDLNAASADPVALVRELKADAELAAIPVVGFFSHVQVELQRAARAAGCDEVMPRSKFVQALPELLKNNAVTRDR
jgi:CheY-like chemotaxis protein